MATSQSIKSAPVGTIWSRSVGGTVYFLNKTGSGGYEVWVSGGTHSPVTLDQAVTYVNQHNLVNQNTATATEASTPDPASDPDPDPAPSPPPSGKPTTTTSPDASNAAPESTAPVDSNTIVVNSTAINNAVTNTNANIIYSPPTTTDPSDLVFNTAAINNATVNPNPQKVLTSSNGSDILINQAAINQATGAQAPYAGPPVLGLSSGITNAQGGATAQDQANFTAQSDWRVRLALAPNSNYLYNADNPGILAPLSGKTINGVKGTNGVIFPYTPLINVTYAATYESTVITHSNYKIFQYQSSSIDSVTITCDFTAQDVFEANYLLAVIHFFRTMTKMFYGKDKNPQNGTPPPLCYIYGLGAFQFDALPLAISAFTYTLPSDVDYIKTTGVSVAATPDPTNTNQLTNVVTSLQRLGAALKPGGTAPKPNYGTAPTQTNNDTTWVPTKIQLSITCLPIMSRNQVSNNFSLADYATGNLLHGTRNGATGGGFW